MAGSIDIEREGEDENEDEMKGDKPQAAPNWRDGTMNSPAF